MVAYGHDTAHHVVDAIVVHPEGLQHDTAGVQTHNHGDESSEVQGDGVLRYSFVVGGSVLGHGLLLVKVLLGSYCY